MSINSIFPDITLDILTEKEQICHSLIEATLLRKSSNDYILSMIKKLKDYKEKNGEDMIIDILFMKYLKKNDIRGIYIDNLNKNEKIIKSQYYIAIKYFCTLNKNEKKILQDQSWKLCTNDMIIIDGIEISKAISFYIYRKHFDFFTKEMIFFKDEIYKDKVQIYENVNMDITFDPKKIEENKIKYKKIMNNIDKFYSINSWTSAILNKAIDNFTIDVNGNPYLFNAAACLCYKNTLIKVKYDITKLKLPENITLDLIKLIRYELPLQKLLEYKTCSIEIKNLCSFIYLLVLDQVSLIELEKYKNLISVKSYSILFLIYMNYTKEYITNDIYDFLFSELNIHDSNDFFLLRILCIILKNCENYKIDDIINDLLYVVSKKTKLKTNEYTNSSYNQIKKRIMAGLMDDSYYNSYYNNMNEKCKLDFLHFMRDAIKIICGEKKLKVIDFYIKIDPNEDIQIEYICYFIDERYEERPYNLLKNLQSNDKIIDVLTDEFHFPKIKMLLNRINRNKALEIIEKFKLKDKLSSNDKINIFYKFSLSTVTLEVDRKSILEKSISIFKRHNMKNAKIRIYYINEKGQDEGGLAKDWFTNVSSEIIKTNAFIPTQNGSNLTFNPNCNDSSIYEFTGKLLACALTNKRIINIKLTTFIWKKIMNEKITIDDMNDYDSEIYKSLKWISENDPEPLMMTFVDSNEEELCPNGKNIELNEANKDQFINLIIENKLIKPNLKAINSIINGFRNILNLNEINLLNSHDIKEIIEGVDIIDVEDWKKNTKHNNKTKYEEFFEIIYNWPQESLKKLLKFVTGSSNVPFGGFNYFNNIGGLFYLNFSSYDSEYLPESHTCFNKVDIPQYSTKEKFERKLLIAIECDTFGLA